MVAARLSSTVRMRDALAFDGFGRLIGLEPLLTLGANLASPLPYVVLGLLCAVAAHVGGRRRHAVAIVLLLGATGAAAEGLKLVLDQGTLHPGGFPSGHATAALTLAFAAVLASPRALRPIAVAGGAALACVVAFSVMALGWHAPSDVLGGFLVAATLAAATVALLDRGEPGRAGAGGAAPAAIVAAGGAGAATVVAVAAGGGTGFAANATAVAVACAIAVLAVTLVAALARIAR